MNQISKVFLACACSLSGLTTQAQDQTVWSNDFSNASQPLNTVGRGVCRVNDGVFHSRSAYALFGNPEWKDYTLSFKARAPKDAEQVQIWAGFRTHNRFDRYVIGIKGGLQDDLYLMRTGYMGTDEFMGVRPLGFHPVPGEWYKVKVEVCGNRIRVFVNDEKLPHIDLEDKNYKDIEITDIMKTMDNRYVIDTQTLIDNGFHVPVPKEAEMHIGIAQEEAQEGAAAEAYELKKFDPEDFDREEESEETTDETADKMTE